MLLLSIILLPLFAAILLALLGGGRAVARWVALLTAIGTLLVALGIASQVTTARQGHHALADTDRPIDGPVQPKLEWRRTWMTLGETVLKEPVKILGFQEGDVREDADGKALEFDATGKAILPPGEPSPPVELPTITTPIRLEFYLGADGISVLLLALTAILTVSAVLISWESIQDRATEFYIGRLALEAGLWGAFVAFDLILFYVFFEFTLIPLFFLVGIWGGVQRQFAAYRFFIYTLAGSVITLLGLASI